MLKIKFGENEKIIEDININIKKGYIILESEFKDIDIKTMPYQTIIFNESGIFVFN